MNAFWGLEVTQNSWAKETRIRLSKFLQSLQREKGGSVGRDGANPLTVLRNHPG